MTIAFDYLDPGDGAVIEVLHTDSKRFPEISGTIKGVPKGCLDWGRLRPMSGLFPFPLNRPRRALIVAFVVGLVFFSAGILIPESVFRQSQPPANQAISFRQILVITGALYAGLPLLVLWLTRRRFLRKNAAPVQTLAFGVTQR